MSASLSLRLVLVVLCIAGLSAAQSCPSAGAADYYHVSSTCPEFDACATTRCTCANSTYSATTRTCNTTLTGACPAIKSCQDAFLVCLVNAAGKANAPACLATLHTALLTGQTSYSGSSLQTSCQADSCRLANGTSSNCTELLLTSCSSAPSFTGNTTNSTTPSPSNNTNTTTPPPTTLLVTVTADVILGGDYSKMGSQMSNFTAVFDSDCSKKLGTTCKTISTKLGSLTITFQANVANATAFYAAVLAAAADSSWLAATKTAFTTFGGTGEFSLIGVSAGGSSVTSAPTPTKGSSTMVFAWSALLAVLVAVFA